MRPALRAVAAATAIALAAGCGPGPRHGARRNGAALSAAGVDSLADALQASDAAAASAELARARRDRGALAPDLAAACDTARALAERVLHVRTRRETGIFDDLDASPRPGCRLSGTGNFAYVDTTTTPPDTILSLLLGRGWRQDLRFQVDGDDGVTLAARDGTVLCIVAGAWDAAGEDGDPGQEAPAPDTTSGPGGSDADSYGLVIECGRDATRPRFDGSLSS